MTKFLEYIEKNAIKIVLNSAVLLGIFLGGLYVSGMRNDINLLGKVAVKIIEQQVYTIDYLRDAQSTLVDIAKTQQYIIDQLRDKVIGQSVNQKVTNKPTYEEIRSHSVWIEGCAGGNDHDNEASFPVGEEGGCWGGTGAVIKVTDTETYILTNNHVTGKGQTDVKLYVENDVTHKLIKAEIVAQHTSVDVAVIKITAQLPGKKAIPGIATAHIQEPVYVVGNPLGVRDVYSEGVVAGYEGVDLLLQMPCIYGNSGSGVFNSSGKLVGVVYALEGYSGFMGIPEVRITHSLVVDSVSIRTFLKDLGLYE